MCVGSGILERLKHSIRAFRANSLPHAAFTILAKYDRKTHPAADSLDSRCSFAGQAASSTTRAWRSRWT